MPRTSSDDYRANIPSLAHPVYAIPLPGEQPHPSLSLVPGFPELRTDFDGALLPGLLWIGINRELASVADDEPPRVILWTQDRRATQRQAPARDGTFIVNLIQTAEGAKSAYVSLLRHHPSRLSLALAHEFISHFTTAQTLTARLFHSMVVAIWRTIEVLCKSESDVTVMVPLTLDWLHVQDNPKELFLANMWFCTHELWKSIQPVDEVFAVWDSVRSAEENGVLPDNYTREDVEEVYKNKYGPWVADFRKLYDRFKRFADRNGYRHAASLANAALNTLAPHEVLRAALAVLNKKKLPKVEDLYVLCGGIADDLVRKDAVLKSRSLLTTWLRLFQQIGDDLLFLRVPTYPLPFYFGSSGTVFAVVSTESTEEQPGSAAEIDGRLWLESMREQLTQGEGLICPRWRDGYCCGSKDLLQRLWRNTKKRAGWPGQWEPRGCITE